MCTNKQMYFIYTIYVYCAAKQLLRSRYFLWFDECYNQLLFHSAENCKFQMDILQGQESIAFSDERVKMRFGSLHAHITQATL